MSTDSSFSSEIEVVEDFFQDTLDEVVRITAKQDIGCTSWLELLEALAQHQRRWTPAEMSSRSPALILQSLTTCHDLSLSQFSMFHPFELYKKYLFLPYNHVGILSPIDAAFQLRTERRLFVHNRTVNAPGWEDAGSIPLSYFQFLLSLKPFVENGYASIIPPKAGGRRSPDGSWVEPEYWELAEKETRGWNSKPGQIIREMILSMEHKAVNASNIDGMSHWGRIPLSRLYDDMAWANQVGGHYIVPNRFILSVIGERADVWESLPKAWKHSPLFRTTIPAEIELPDLSAFPVKNMLQLRKNTDLWSKWQSTIETAFARTSQLTSEDDTIDAGFAQAYREEIQDKAADLRRQIEAQSPRNLARSALFTFTVAVMSCLIVDPSSVPVSALAAGGLLKLLSDILFKRSEGECLYNHYSMLEPRREE